MFRSDPRRAAIAEIIPLALLGVSLTLGGCASTSADRAAADAETPAVSRGPQFPPGAGPDWIRANYNKAEHAVPMRDGVRLHTTVYTPKDMMAPRPILMMRTPYSARPYGEDNFPAFIGPHQNYALKNYIIVYQDVRGAWNSEGDFVNMTPHVPVKRSNTDIDESTDTYDTVDWLINNIPGNNGRVGLWGISYPGFYAAASMIDAHPNLVASSPQAPIADWWYDDFHHHGAFFLPHTFNFISVFGLPRPEPTTTRPPRPWQYPTADGFDFYLNHVGPLSTLNGPDYADGQIAFWNETIAHPNYDEFWQKRNILPHLNRVAPNVLTVGGWFDAEDLYGPLQIYRSIEHKNPRINNRLVMGPWRHGGWARSTGSQLGDAYFGEGISEFYRTRIEQPFFDYHLLGEGQAPDLPEASVFETGRNRWRAFDNWPPADLVERQLFAKPGGSLEFDSRPAESVAYDEFVSDPAKPVPYTEFVSTGMVASYMTEDQRFAGRRPDVLVYQTETLDEPLTLAGPIVADLWVSTDQRDADWVVKIIDVHPGDHPDFKDRRESQRTGGYQMMVRSEVIRGRFREGPERAVPFTPNEPTLVRLPLQDVLHTFKPGHRLMIQIQSTWFPLVDRNPQSWVDNIFLAEADDFVTATHRVHRSREHPTRFILGVLPQNAIENASHPAEPRVTAASP